MTERGISAISLNTIANVARLASTLMDVHAGQSDLTRRIRRQKSLRVSCVAGLLVFALAGQPVRAQEKSPESQTLNASIALKPTSSIRLPRRSIDRKGKPTTVQTTGRHDPCVGIRATPIAEAMLACVLMDHALRHRAQCADVKPPAKPIPGKAR